MTETKTLEACATQLLSATEGLHDALVDEASTEAVGEAFAKRVAAFEALRVAVESGGRVGPTVRACLDRVRALDAELIGRGAELASAAQTERHALGRKRAAIQAHGSRERPEPRAVIVKA